MKFSDHILDHENISHKLPMYLTHFRNLQNCKKSMIQISSFFEYTHQLRGGYVYVSLSPQLQWDGRRWTPIFYKVEKSLFLNVYLWSDTYPLYSWEIIFFADFWPFVGYRICIPYIVEKSHFLPIFDLLSDKCKYHPIDRNLMIDVSSIISNFGYFQKWLLLVTEISKSKVHLIWKILASKFWLTTILLPMHIYQIFKI